MPVWNCLPPKIDLQTYWKFSIIIRFEPSLSLLVKRMVLPSGETLRPTIKKPSIFVSSRLLLFENW